MSLDLDRAKSRLTNMILGDAICMAVAVGAAVGRFVYGITWLQWVFGAAILAGFAVQIWFIAGLRRKGTET